MGSWKRARVFNWELMFGISSLIFAFMAAGAPPRVPFERYIIITYSY